MDSKDIVRGIIIGGPAIDRMRQEINSLVSTAIGLVRRCAGVHFLKFEKFDIVSFSSPKFQGCTWRLVFRDSSRDGRAPLDVRCDLNIGLGDTVFERNDGKFDIPHEHVQRVHESLPLFIDGIKKTFPFLEDYHWQPFLDAADYAEKNGWNQLRGDAQ